MLHALRAESSDSSGARAHAHVPRVGDDRRLPCYAYDTGASPFVDGPSIAGAAPSSPAALACSGASTSAACSLSCIAAWMAERPSSPWRPATRGTLPCRFSKDVRCTVARKPERCGALKEPLQLPWRAYRLSSERRTPRARSHAWMTFRPHSPADTGRSRACARPQPPNCAAVAPSVGGNPCGPQLEACVASRCAYVHAWACVRACRTQTPSSRHA